MQTNYDPVLARAIEGLTVGHRQSQPANIPLIAQVDQGVIGTGTVGNLVFTLVEEKTGQTRTLTVALSTTTLATSLDEIKAAWEADGNFNNLASVAENGVTTYTVTYKQADKAYTLSSVPPGSMTNVITTPTSPSRNDFRLARFVAEDDSTAEGYIVRALASGDTISDIVGALFRKDGNHFHELEPDDVNSFDVLAGGQTHSAMTKGRMWFAAGEESMPLGSAVWVRIAGAGEVGSIRATDPGGGNAIDISTIARVEEPAAAVGDLVLIRVNLQP